MKGTDLFSMPFRGPRLSDGLIHPQVNQWDSIFAHIGWAERTGELERIDKYFQTFENRRIDLA